MFSPNWDPIEIHRVHLVISLYLVFSLLEHFSTEVKLTFNFNASVLNVHLMSFTYIHTHTHMYTLTTITTSKYRKCSLMPTLQPTAPSPPAPVNHWSDCLTNIDSFAYQELHKSKNLDLLLFYLASFAQHIFENHLSYCVYEKFVPFYWSVRVNCMNIPDHLSIYRLMNWIASSFMLLWFKPLGTFICNSLWTYIFISLE